MVQYKEGTFTLVLIRHGQTTGNRDGIQQGQLDYPLTKRGILSAKILGLSLKNVEWTGIWSSDLPRSVKTACYLLEQRCVPLEAWNDTIFDSSDLLDADVMPLDLSTLEARINKTVHLSVLAREVCKGCREGLPKNLTMDEARAIVAQKRGVPVESVVDCSETYDQIVSRQRQLLHDIIRSYYSDVTEKSQSTVLSENCSNDWGNVLVVTHGKFIKVFLNSWCGLPEISIQNCSISKIKVSYKWDGTHVLSDSIQCTCDSECLNFTHHLPESYEKCEISNKISSIIQNPF